LAHYEAVEHGLGPSHQRGSANRLSRLDETKAAVSKGHDSNSSADEAYGNFIADHLAGVSLAHFSCFKLDPDIDGTNNSFQTVRLKEIRNGQALRKSVWVSQSRIAAMRWKPNSTKIRIVRAFGALSI
jgi:Cu2+-containing amine oxidase